MKEGHVHIRVELEVIEQWKAAAMLSGLSLAAWIRLRCRGVDSIVAPGPQRNRQADL